jgi:hypothetical protein
LAPASGIRELMRWSVGSYSLIADHFGVSDLVIKYQVDNQLSLTS